MIIKFGEVSKGAFGEERGDITYLLTVTGSCERRAPVEGDNERHLVTAAWSAATRAAPRNGSLRIAPGVLRSQSRRQLLPE